MVTDSTEAPCSNCNSSTSSKFEREFEKLLARSQLTFNSLKASNRYVSLVQKSKNKNNMNRVASLKVNKELEKDCVPKALSFAIRRQSFKDRPEKNDHHQNCTHVAKLSVY
jgi:hypothetical protein